MIGEYKQLNIFDILNGNENITITTICKNIENMLKKTPEEKKYLDDWDEYIVNFRDKDSEQKINSNQIELELDIRKMFEKSPKEFKHSYKYDRNNLDCSYGTGRPTLRYLFENNYKYLIISSKSELWKKCLELRVHAIHSPFAKDFITYELNYITLFIKENDLFYLQGVGFHNVENHTWIGYLGKVK